MTGPAQRRGTRSTQSGTSTQQAQGIGGINPKEVDLETTAPVRAIKKRKVHSIIGSTNSSGLLIQGSYEHALESASNPEGTTPASDSKSFRSPDFPISYSGLGIPKFVSPIRIASVDENLSISNNLSVNNNVDIGGILSVGGVPLSGIDSTDFMKLNEDNTATGIQNFTNSEESTSSTTGGVRITGGLGVKLSVDVGLNVLVGGGIGVEEQFVSTSVDNSTSINSGAIVTDGGVGIVQDVFIGGDVDIAGTLEVGGVTLPVDDSDYMKKSLANTATEKNTFSNSEQADGGGLLGAVIVAGGVDIAKKLYVQGVEVNTHLLDHTDYMTKGADNTVIGRQIINNSTVSTSTTTGAVTVLGGVGIGDKLHVSDSITVMGIEILGADYANNHSTGLDKGGFMTLNAGLTYDISAGSGEIIDSSDPDNPLVYHISWAAKIAVPVSPSDATNLFQFSYIDTNGDVLHSLVDPTPSLRRNNIALGKIFTLDGLSINAVNNRPEPALNPANQASDFFRGLGPIVLNGLRASGGGLLEIDVSAGSLHQDGVNFHTDPQQPNIKDYISNETAVFAMATQDDVFLPTVTDVDVGFYDLNGTKTIVTGGSNSATNMRLYLFNSGFLTIQYGQQIYASLAGAQAGVVTEPFIREKLSLENGVLIAVLSVKGNATDLTNPTHAVFFSASKFGEINVGVGGTQTSTLQSVYDNSTQPQILLASALGALQIRDAATPIAAPLFEVLDSGGNNIFKVEDPDVTIDGNLTITGLVQSGVATVTGLTTTDTLKVTGSAAVGSLTTDLITTTGTLEVTTQEIEMNHTSESRIAFNDSSNDGHIFKIWGRSEVGAGTGQMGFYDSTNNITYLKYYAYTNSALRYMQFSASKEAASKTSASVIMDGGLGVAKKIWANDIETTADITANGDLKVDTILASGASENTTIMSNLTTGSIGIGNGLTTGKIRIGDSMSGRETSSAINTGGIVTMLDRNTSGTEKAYLEFFRRTSNDQVNIMAAKVGGDADLVLRGTDGSNFTLGAGQTTGIMNISTGITTGDINIGTGITTGDLVLGGVTSGTVSIGNNLSGRTFANVGNAGTGGSVIIGDVADGGTYLEMLHVNDTNSFYIRPVKTGDHGDLQLGGTSDTRIFIGRGSTSGEMSFAVDTTTGPVNIGPSLTTGNVKIGESLTTGDILIGNSNDNNVVAFLGTSSTDYEDCSVELSGGISINKDVYIGKALSLEDKTNSANMTCNAQAGSFTYTVLISATSTVSNITFTNDRISSSSIVMLTAEKGNFTVGFQSATGGSAQVSIRNLTNSNVTGHKVYFMVI
jgi:hypothetical protein